MAWFDRRTGEDRGRGLLADLRVLSFGAFVAGNTAGLVLAELGADVVKIESLRRPEALRSYFSVDHGEIYEPSGVRTTALWSGYARSTRSLCINMDVEEGRSLFRDLVAQADVVIENLGPQQMERWGADYPALAARNPALVMAAISGYGRSGPRASYRSYGSNICNYLGLTSAWSVDGTHFDFVSGYHAASAILSALHSVAETGRGVYIDLAQAETGAAVMAPLYMDALNGGSDWSYPPNTSPGSLLSAVLPCRGDDEWVAIDIEDPPDWNSLCALLERPDLAIAEDVAEAQGRVTDLVSAMQKWSANETSLQVTLKLQKVGLAAAPVSNMEDLWRDPQLRSRGVFVDVHHPDIGTIEYPESPDRADRTPGRVRSAGPRLGEHGRAVLTEWMGFSNEHIQDLKLSEAFWDPEDPTPATA